MTAKEVQQYWDPAAINLFSSDYPLRNIDRICIMLDAALGVNLYTSCTGSWGAGEELPEEMKRLLLALAGPHGKTILRAYQIQKGLDT